MNATQMAAMAYAPAQPATRSPRSIEAQLFAKITARLSDSADDYPAFAQALHQNRQMWSAFAADVADADNGLPSDMRAQIFYLAEFTAVHSQKVLRGSADVAPLVDINMSILRGLQQDGSAA